MTRMAQNAIPNTAFRPWIGAPATAVTVHIQVIANDYLKKPVQILLCRLFSKTKLQKMIYSSGSNTIYRNAEAVLWKQIENTAKQIQEERVRITHPGLLSGKSGIVLFFAYLSKLFPEKTYSDVTAGILDELSDSLSNDELDHSMSGGVAGIAFAF